MLLVSSGAFFMGSAARDAAPHEQPVSQVSLSCFYLGRFPVTLYKEQWTKLLTMADEIRAFIKDHDTELKAKPQA